MSEVTLIQIKTNQQDISYSIRISLDDYFSHIDQSDSVNLVSHQINIIMFERSRLMMRPKQQLQNQLLMAFRKKNNQYASQIQLSERVKNVCSISPNRHQNKSYTAKNNTILDQFSKCPIRDDEQLAGQTFLNKFMFTKNQILLPSSAKTSVFVQTDRNTQHQLVSNTNLKHTKDKAQTMLPKNGTPRVADFDARADKSLIDISGNISGYKYPISEKKQLSNQNRILTDSIIEQQRSDKGKTDQSAEQLLNQLENADQSLQFKRVESGPEVMEKIEPIVKKIQLSRPKNKAEEAKENTNKNIPMRDPDEQSQQNEKLEKLLSKKSLIKSLIVNKNLEQLNKSKQKEEPISKWAKPNKKSWSNQDISPETFPGNPRVNQVQQEPDPLDLLPPYETSSSGLQAVIEEQNQSQMEESIKHKKNQPQNALPFDQKKLSEKKPQGTIKDERTIINSIPQQNFQAEPLKQISIGDLSLEDVSEIQNVSGNKKLPDSFKKIKNEKDFSDDLPDYEDSYEEKKPEENVKMQRYIVNDIANDIKNLKKRISNDASFDTEDIEKIKPKPKQELKVPGQKKPIDSVQGSQGVDRKLASMLDFFDQINDKLDFGEISKDINGLRDRMANDSQ